MLSVNGCVDLKPKIDPQVGVASKQIQGDNSGNNDFWPIVIGSIVITVILSVIGGYIIVKLRSRQIDTESEEDKIRDEIIAKCLEQLFAQSNRMLDFFNKDK